MSIVKYTTDIHTAKPKHKIYLPKVGIRQFKIPLNLLRKDKKIQQVVASVSFYVDLKSKTRGTNMSRLPRLLYACIDSSISIQFVKKILLEASDFLESQNSYLKLRFVYPILKKSPVSDNKAYEFYDCAIEAIYINKKFQYFLTVNVPYMSTCPCSAEGCEKLIKVKKIKAYPHAQRSNAEVTVEFKENNIVYIEDLVSMVEKAVKTIPYPILKREDEYKVAEMSGKYQLFVEDAARVIANVLNKDKRIIDWCVVCNHYEQIHTHDAVCIVFKGKRGGLR